MDVAEANRIALTALRSVLSAAHPFEVTIAGEPIRVTPRAPSSGVWPRGPVGPSGLNETADGPWPARVLIDCAWAGGRVTLEMLVDFWRGSGRYGGQLGLKVATSPLNREILWTTVASRVLAAEPGHPCLVPVSLMLFAREGESNTRRLLASLIDQSRALGLQSITPTTFELFAITIADGEVSPSPLRAFERVVSAALVKLPYLVRGEQSDVEGSMFIDINQPRRTPTAPPIDSPGPAQQVAPVGAESLEVSTQENVFFQRVELCDVASFERFVWADMGRINVIVGANDTGKSHLLKLLYALARSVQEYTARVEQDAPTWGEVLAEKLLGTFQPRRGQLGALVRHGSTGERLEIGATLCNEPYSVAFPRSAGRSVGELSVTDAVRPQPGLRALFIPPKEVLTSLDAIAAVREQLHQLGFDDTYYDLVKALRGEPPMKPELPDAFRRVLDNLESLLTGRIETDFGRFVFRRGDDSFDMPEVAEGIKKIGILARLLQNGSLRRDSILILDEPEANLHPHAARELVHMLYDLSEAGVQIFAATHSYFVLKQFELVARRHKTQVTLCCLSRDGNAIEPSFFDLQEGMPPNGIVEEALLLYDEDIDVALGA